MTIFTKRQSLSNMLRRIFASLILGGLVAVCTCEPANRRRPLLAETAGTTGCADDEDNAAARGISRTAGGAFTPEPREDRTRRTGRELGREDSDVQVSARKKGRFNYGRILLFMVGAMKAALVYGMLHGVAALAGKAILVAKIALALAIAALIKKNDHQKVSYEIVKHPHHSYIQTHSSSVDYDHRSDGDEGYDHRKRRRILR